MHDPAARSPLPRLAILALALLVAGTLVLEYLLVLRATWAEAGPLRASIRYFSYFTILSNIAVLLACVSALGGAPAFFTRPAVRGAVTVYIGLTGALYALLLRNTWDPQGLPLLTDVSLHYVVPALSVLAWLAGPGHGALRWWHAVAWLAFPAGYLAWVLLRGAMTGEYPYPFVDAAALGLSGVLTNTAALLGVFLAAGWLLVMVDRIAARRLLPARAST
jgi:hypothetical protein